jgi:hypothetical protein
MRSCALIKACAVFGLIALPLSSARAQGTANDVPVYPQPPTHPSLGTPDSYIFDPITVAVPLRVPLVQLQQYVDRIAPGRFVAVARSDDPTTAVITWTNAWQRVTSNSTITSSRLAFFATVDDALTRLRRTAVLDIYATNADQIDSFFGVDAARQAEIRWELRVKEKGNKTKYAFSVHGEDGFQMSSSITVATDDYGTLNLSSPSVPLVHFVALGDGPGGTHPGFVNVSRRYDVRALEVEVEDQLRMRFGDFDILEVVSSGPTFATLRRNSAISLTRIP